MTIVRVQVQYPEPNALASGDTHSMCPRLI
jgi:hypothetical protein